MHVLGAAGRLRLGSALRIGCLLGASLHRLDSPETRYRGAGAPVIQTDDQMLLAQQCVANLRGILLEARKVHSSQDFRD